MSLDRHAAAIARWLKWLAIAVFALAVVLAAATLRAAEEELPGKPVATAAEAVGWALADIATLGEADRPFARYVWIPPWGDELWVAGLNFSLNTAASHATTLQLGTPIANGWMVRYDLRRLAPVEKQLERLRAVWDGLATQDPYFHVPATNTGLQAAVIAPHLKEEQAVALAGLSLSTGAIYRADFLVVKMLSTLEGGKYYDFLQVDRQVSEEEKTRGVTPQDKWLATLGVFEQTTRNLSGDQRSAIFRSAVTGKPRRIDVFYGLGRGGNLCTITHDISDEDVGAGQHPIRNLLEFRDSAREIIVERPNGTHAFALTNAQGEFQDAAPDNVARDHTVPAPHTSRLQPAISCIRCHGPHDGLQPFGNDVKTILKSRLDVFADLGASEQNTREQVVDRLAGLYAGQLDAPDGPIGRGRRDYGTTLYRIALDSVFGVDDARIVAELSHAVSDIFSSYRYDVVSPERACLELGLEVGDGEGIAGLDRLLGDPSLAIVVDPVVGSLRAGISINRTEFEQVFVDLSLQAESIRTGKTMSELRPVGKPIEAAPVVDQPTPPAQPTEPPPAQPPPARPNSTNRRG